MNKKELIEELKSQGIKDKILSAIKKIPREYFIPEDMVKYAYENRPLEIGYNQTISQPYTVAFMIQNLEIKEDSKILEIGSGSGYNAAVMSRLTKKRVYSIEIIPELVKFGKENLKKAEIKNVRVILGNGSIGYKKEAPYDRIIVAAGASKIPQELISQLKNNGILIIPVGSHYQDMIKIKKINGKIIKENLGEFVFVPLKVVA